LSVGITALGTRQALIGPVVAKTQIPIEGLPAALEGFSIAQISDLHVGPTIDREYVEDVVTTVQSLGADVIAVTGDLADGSPEELRERIDPLAGLKAEHGVFYITGNHEYYWGVESWIEAARGLGFQPLLNENRLLNVRGQHVLIGGVTDK